MILLDVTPFDWVVGISAIWIIIILFIAGFYEVKLLSIYNINDQLKQDLKARTQQLKDCLGDD